MESCVGRYCVYVYVRVKAVPCVCVCVCVGLQAPRSLWFARSAEIFYWLAVISPLKLRIQTIFRCLVNGDTIKRSHKGTVAVPALNCGVVWIAIRGIIFLNNNSVSGVWSVSHDQNELLTGLFISFLLVLYKRWFLTNNCLRPPRYYGHDLKKPWIFAFSFDLRVGWFFLLVHLHRIHFIKKISLSGYFRMLGERRSPKNVRKLFNSSYKQVRC